MNYQPKPAPAIEETEHLWIAMPDGLRLAARLWLPNGARDQPVPALFETIPYRKADLVRARDERNHPFFAKKGYACLRVDMRGSGDSEGRMSDMYTPEELSDTRHVIEWIAAQPWCDGSVGMFGTSWGGTASLQASLDPPAALKAVIAVCATHDRYEDDIHHMGGLILTDSIEWGATLPAILALPPSREAFGDQWRKVWEERLETLAFPLEHWVREEERSAYWQHGSITTETDRIGCPVLAVGGWSDRYSNSVMSLVDKCPEKVRGIVGPWGHHYPDVGHPGPAMGFQQEALKWWDLWLKGRGDPAKDWPQLRVWLRDFDPPAEVIPRRRGAWIQTGEAPSEATSRFTLFPSEGALTSARSRGGQTAAIPHDLCVGSAAGDTGYFGRHGGLPADQNADDRRSLVFETEPLTEDFLLFGAAELDLEVVSDQPIAQIAARLNDVAPDGSSARVALALRNLALHDDFQAGAPMKPGEARRCRIAFPTTAYRFAPGHRIRLALSSSYWPLAWPVPVAAKLTISTGACALHLPLLKAAPEAPAHPLPAPLDPPPTGGCKQVSAPPLTRRSGQTAEGALFSSWHQPFACQKFWKTGISFGTETLAHHLVDPDQPLSAISRVEHRASCKRLDGHAEVKSWAELRARDDSYLLSGGLTASWNGETIATRSWSPKMPRRLA